MTLPEPDRRTVQPSCRLWRGQELVKIYQKYIQYYEELLNHLVSNQEVPRTTYLLVDRTVGPISVADM